MAAVAAGDFNKLRHLVVQLVDSDGQKAIPLLIGVMDADNSQDTVYDVGYFGLRCLVPDVPWSFVHDGPWWRRWWKAHREQFPEAVRAIPIPDLPKTNPRRRTPSTPFPCGSQYTPFPDDIDTLQGKLRLAPEILAGEKVSRAGGAGLRMMTMFYAEEVAGHEDPHAIPYLIGMIVADPATADQVGNYALRPLTGVKVQPSHDARWWQQWWRENKSKYPAEVQAIPIPDYRSPLTFAWKEPTAEEKNRLAQQKRLEAMADVADIPAQDLIVPGNPRMRYFLIGPRKGVHAPKEGFKLVVVMPGGDGSDAFHPFVRRLYKYAMPDDCLVVQPVAVRWPTSQQIVWPIRHNPVKNQEFSTEDFVEAVIKDAAARQPIDRRFIFTLSWSSSGPAAYAIAIQEKTAVTGSYIAMSVFHRRWLPPVERAKGRLFLIEHSPQDKICPYADALEAQQELLKAGAAVRLVTYEGGHGWHGRVYPRVREGLFWLVGQRSESRK